MLITILGTGTAWKKTVAAISSKTSAKQHSYTYSQHWKAVTNTQHF